MENCCQFVFTITFDSFLCPFLLKFFGKLHVLGRERQIAPPTCNFPVLFLNIALDQSAQEKSLSYCEKKILKKYYSFK